LLLSTWLAVVMLEVFKKTGWVLNNYSQFCFCKNLPKHGRHGQPFFGLVNRFCNYKRHHIFRKGLCGYHAEIIFSQNNLAFRASHAKKLFQKFIFHSKRFSPMRSSWFDLIAGSCERGFIPVRRCHSYMSIPVFCVSPHWYP
jgi:hypothetical protein